MDTSLLITILVGLAVTMLAVAGLAYYYQHLIKTGTHPELKRMTMEALILAYKSSEYFADKVEDRLHSAAKKEISGYVYDNLLADTIQVGPMKIQWKKLVTREMFVNYCSAQLDAIAAKFRSVIEAIGSQLADLDAEHTQ